MVLVNGGSASTSELLAGALRDGGGEASTDTGVGSSATSSSNDPISAGGARQVLLLGEATFGKGVSQEVAPLSDGSLLFFTNASYLTPARR